jgi:NAD(P)-dependent dehydrogenase (short-subunit alcohol dehydrogenase family)
MISHWHYPHFASHYASGREACVRVEVVIARLRSISPNALLPPTAGAHHRRRRIGPGRLRRRPARMSARRPHQGEIEEAAAAIRARGEKADALVLDVTDIEAARKALAAREPYQVLINNAGMNRPAYLPEVKVEDFDAIMALNVRAAFFMAQTVALRRTEAKLPGSTSTSPRRWATSAPRAAPSTAPASTRWRALPRRWRSNSRRTTSASIRWVRPSSKPR